ncbi:MAG: FAD-dependent oxidoreductase [Pseudomonadota bacterium]
MTLPEKTQIVVVGGGIVGCSTAYHLARDHKAEVLLLEQGQLTSGSTWHAAGLVGQLRASASITQVLKRSVELYATLDAETGLETGWKMSGCLRLACNADRWVEYRRLATTARSFGMEMHLLSPDEVKRLWPLMDTRDLVGASWLPTDGQANPSDIALSLAKGARMRGVTIREGVRVTGLQRVDGRITAVETSDGPIEAETVILCAGQWTRQLGAKAGVTVPLQPIKHQYVVTEPISGLATDAPTVRDPDRRTYFKEEVGGLAFGGYEPNPQGWTLGDVPDEFAFRLFDDDWDHFEQHLSAAVERVPALAETGVKQMINGPESFTPDGNFILGRAPGCANLYIGAGFNAYGIAAGGGAGWALAEWALSGEAPLDLWSVDIRRFAGVHGDRDWVSARTLEAYGRHYAIGYPHGEPDSGRPKQVSPLFDRLRDRGAVFGEKLGWERANWFGPAGELPRDEPSMGHPSWQTAVAAEHRAVRETAGLFDQSSFAKFELSGPDAAASLDWICAGPVMRPPGRVTYTQLLNARGGIECDLTVARLAEDRFYIVTGTGFRTHDGAWILDQMPVGAEAHLEDVTDAFGTLSLFGPRARAILAAVTPVDVSNESFPFAAVREIEIAGQPVRALRITYVGELGWELHIPIDGMAAVFDALVPVGEPQGLRLCGYRAIESLRLEKGYRAWGADISPTDSPLEAGLRWAVKLKQPVPFLGREAVEAAARRPLSRRLCGFSCDASAVLLGRETILRNGEPVGYLRSGGMGHTVGRAIGYGYVSGADVSADWLREGRYHLVVAAEEIPSELHLTALYDPEGQRIRA